MITVSRRASVFNAQSGYAFLNFWSVPGTCNMFHCFCFFPYIAHICPKSYLSGYLSPCYTPFWSRCQQHSWRTISYQFSQGRMTYCGRIACRYQLVTSIEEEQSKLIGAGLQHKHSSAITDAATGVCATRTAPKLLEEDASFEPERTQCSQGTQRVKTSQGCD